MKLLACNVCIISLNYPKEIMKLIYVTTTPIAYYKKIKIENNKIKKKTIYYELFTYNM